jgi:predicted N-acyltransferase
MPMHRCEWLSSVDAIDAAQWNALLPGSYSFPPGGYPFLRHEFLAALERSGSASAATGWQPQHLLLWRGKSLIAALPLYLKTHSYGEYVFDWSWAEAWQRSGLSYYPKLLCAIPFTPATGPRLLLARDENIDDVLPAMLTNIRERIGRDALSSFHLLFPDAALMSAASGLLSGLAPGLASRMGAQYHWFNRGYTDFEAFLATFSSRKRKNVRRERAAVAAQGLRLRVLEGADISAGDWQRFYRFYRETYAKRSGHAGYLNEEFFAQIGRTLAAHSVMVVAECDGEAVAAALYFRDATTLYGRYWGCTREFDSLHFEACYYQGIDYCIRNGLSRFDPGAQGEHKIARGFEPVATWSLHWIAHPGLRAAVDDFLARERRHVENYLRDAAGLLPFRIAANERRL